MKITKRKIVELLNSLDDDVEIEFNAVISKHWKKGELNKIGISFI